ncbi:hypothetical protein [Anaerotruncus massiliensis (ex Togo et al. 2019)]|uniref:hypothetical protein n=1 Tax=Anaerotruncus TaxID=244127 RepID=UPI000C772EEF|nr:hypothetical protein [Anaerotruncus massiliensis (ex Togo et al. 2019)]
MDENRTMGDLGGEAEETATENVLELKHPLKVDGEEIDKIEYDFDVLTAKDLHEASKYLKQLGIPVSVPALDMDYQLTVFGKAVKKRMPRVTLNDLMRLSSADAMKATGLTRDFLLDLDPGQRELGSDE